MRKYWLRGMLLGVSVALLLAGGVALAASVYVRVDKECVECWSGSEEPPDAYFLTVEIGGWDHAYDWYCDRIRIDDELLFRDCQTLPFEDPDTFKGTFTCEWREEPRPRSVLGREVTAANGPPSPLGEWNYRVWQPDSGEADQASWTVAEVCEVEAEFVPEPGTIMLLGSGLAGLAGYATLRLRKK